MDFNQIFFAESLLNLPTPEEAREALLSPNHKKVASVVQLLDILALTHMCPSFHFVPPQASPLKKNLRYFLDYGYLEPVCETDSVDSVFDVCTYLFYQGAYCIAEEIYMAALQMLPDMNEYRTIEASIFKAYVCKFHDKEQNLNLIYDMIPDEERIKSEWLPQTF